MAVPGGTLLSTVNQNGLPSTSAAKSMQSDSIFAIFFGSKFATTMTVLFNNSSGSKNQRHQLSHLVFRHQDLSGL